MGCSHLMCTRELAMATTKDAETLSINGERASLNLQIAEAIGVK
jgi:hypothetical protein